MLIPTLDPLDQNCLVIRSPGVLFMHLDLKITDLIPLSLISFCIHTVWGLKMKTAGLCPGLVLSSHGYA